MAKEYIEREKAIDLLKNRYQDMSAMSASFYAGFQYALKMIERIKTADAAPVRHGRRIYHDDGVITCSECGNAESRESHYCRYCGAKMDGEHIGDVNKT